MSTTIPPMDIGADAAKTIMGFFRSDRTDIDFLKPIITGKINVNSVASSIIIGMVVASATMIIATELCSSE